MVGAPMRPTVFMSLVGASMRLTTPMSHLGLAYGFLSQWRLDQLFPSLLRMHSAPRSYSTTLLTIKQALLCAVMIALVACSTSDAPADSVTADGTDTAGAVGTATTVDSATTDSLTSTPQAPAALLALDGEGLRVVNAQTGATRAISYGTPGTDAVNVVTALLGGPTDRGANSECGAGPVEFVTFPGGLQLVLQDGLFVGWTARPNDGLPLRTMSNIGLGSTRAELESVYLATISRTTIGVEFMAGGLQGVLESDAPTARITDLWSGVSCVFR